MDIEKAAHALGVAHGSFLLGIEPKDFETVKGASDAFEEAYRNRTHTELMKAAWVLLEATGHVKQANIARALHILPRNHSETVKKASDAIYDTMQKCANLLPFMTGGVGLAAKGFQMTPAAAQFLVNTLVGTSVLGGGALGSIYNFSKREVADDTAEQTAMRNKIDFYNQLADEMSSRLDKMK
jgi:hypothetical protein